MPVGSSRGWDTLKFIINAYCTQNAEYALRFKQYFNDLVGTARETQEKDEQTNPEAWNNYFDGKETN